MQPSLRPVARQADKAVSSRGEEAAHLHQSQLSIWPLVLSAAIALLVVGLLFVPDHPWLALIALPLILVGIVNWALEVPAVASPPAQESIERHDTLILPMAIAESVREGVDDRREAVVLADTTPLIIPFSPAHIGGNGLSTSYPPPPLRDELRPHDQSGTYTPVHNAVTQPLMTPGTDVTPSLTTPTPGVAAPFMAPGMDITQPLMAPSPGIHPSLTKPAPGVAAPFMALTDGPPAGYLPPHWQDQSQPHEAAPRAGAQDVGAGLAPALSAARQFKAPHPGVTPPFMIPIEGNEPRSGHPSPSQHNQSGTHAPVPTGPVENLVPQKQEMEVLSSDAQAASQKNIGRIKLRRLS